MNKLTSMFSGLTKGASRMVGGSMKSKRVHNAYEIGDYETMMSLVSTMSHSQFIKEIRQDDLPILHRAVMEDKYDAVEALTQLPYFEELANDNSYEEGWTPLLWAVNNSTRSDLKVFKLLVDHGAQLLKPKTSDGLTALHIAATTNDVHIVDFILENVDNPK